MHHSDRNIVTAFFLEIYFLFVLNCYLFWFAKLLVNLYRYKKDSFLLLKNSESFYEYLFFWPRICLCRLFCILSDVRIRTQSASVASRCASNLATHLPISEFLYYLFALYFSSTTPGPRIKIRSFRCSRPLLMQGRNLVTSQTLSLRARL